MFEASMFEVSVNQLIDVSPDRAWEIIDDFGGVYRFHPRVEKSPLKPGPSSGLGAQRTCYFDDGNKIQEEVVEYEPHRALGIEITDPGKFPLKESMGRISLEPVGDRQTRVTFKIQFVPKFGLVGRLMGKVIMVPQFEKILGSVLTGLETHALTGAVVSRKGTTTAAAA